MLAERKAKMSFKVKVIFHSESTCEMSKSLVLPPACSFTRPVSAVPSTITSGTDFSTYSRAETSISLGFTRRGST